MGTSAQLIGNLVHRVAIRLPYKSGQPIELVEQDPIVKQTVAALIEVSKYRLPTVANTLCYVLEGVSKTHQIYEKNVPIATMQSKLFVLRLLSACMQHHRHYYCEQERRKRPEIPSNELILQLPPLDAPLVTFVLVLMSRYITQYHLIEESNSESTPQQIYDYDNTKYSYEQIKLSLITEIYKASAKILHYVSSSNWNECYAKIKHAVLSLGSIKKILDDIPPEIRMLECICLNKERLQLVFKELNPYYLHMRQQGRLLFSKLIRKAIWRWIESYPNEFAQVFTTAPLLDSEQLFDMCNSTADSSKNKSVLWPLQTILLVLSPESLMQAFNGQSSNRRASFLGLLKKSLKNAKNIDLISVCYVDICKAATYVPPETESILRMIAADVEKDLRDKVWDFTQLINIESTVSTLGYTIDQQTLVADFLLSRIRLDKNNTIKALVPSCIDLNSPITAKLALVKSCLAILLEENHLPWNPTLESLYDGLCAPLRTLMLQTIQIEMDSKKKEDTITNHTSRVELLVDMFRLYRIDPLFALLGEGNRVEQNGLLMNGLAVSLVHPVQVIRQSAAELLIKLHRLEYVSHWTSDPNNMHDFWKVSSPTIAVISQRILDTSLNEEMQKFLLDTTIKLLKTRSVFLKHKQALFTSESCNTRERLQAHVSLEIALLISSCSAHKSVCDEASACIAALCQESKIIDVWDEGLNNLSIASDLEVYESFSAENYQFVGRKAQQKRFRKCLQTLFHHTPSCFAAWEEAWTRWEMLTPFVNKVQEDNEENINEGVNGSNKKFPLVGKNDKLKSNITPMTLVSSKSQQNQDNYEERSVEWHNFTGFLAALGGCCLTRERELDEVVSLSSDHSKRTNNRPLVMIEGFIAKMTKMLVSDNVYVREGIKDILGNDLSPALLAILFRHLEHQMNKCFDFNGKAIRNPQNKLFVEQSILVLRLILDRLGNPSDCLLNIDFSTLMRQFINYLDGVPNTVITLRIKIKMCMLVEVLMQKKERIIIQDGIALRNRILEILVEWTSDVALLRKPLEGGPQVERLQLDLDLACLKTIVKVLHELPLQLLDSVRVHDCTMAKNRLFLKYFNFFKTVLDRYKRTERNIAANRSTVDSRDSISNSTAGSYQYVSQMKELTILAMSHLLSANVEAGLKYSLSMGYDDDEKTRTSFMEVLKNILEHGTGFEMLSESATTDRYEKLIDLLVEVDMEVIMALCDACPTSDSSGLAEVLLICFESRNKITPLLKAIVDREVAQTNQEATLFRGTTIATRILSIYARFTCINYICNTLSPAMEYINSLPDDQLTWELDPQKIKPTENLSKNIQNVTHVTETLLETILSSVNDIPVRFRQELEIICKSVGSRFPESKYTAVGSFVFLRLFGPVIVSPENARFAKKAIPKSTNVRKILLQATRIIQNLASNVIFGATETHLIKLNDFLTTNVYRVMTFLREASTIPTDYEEPTGSLLMDQTGYLRLHKYLSENIERMSKELTGRHLANGSNTQSVLHFQKALDSFSTILAQLGRPSEIPNMGLLFARNYTVVVNNPYFTEFIRRNAHRDLSPISTTNVFYLGGKSKEGKPVFYMFMRAIDNEDMDFELFIYYLLRVVEPYLNDSFELLFDCTGFTLSNAIPIPWLSQLFQMVFMGAKDHLTAFHILNPNTQFQQHFNKLPNAIKDRIIKKTYLYSSLAELSQNISLSEMRLSKTTMDLERNSNVVIQSVMRLDKTNSSIPVTMKISSEEVQLITVKKQKLIDGLYTVFRDVYHISECEEIAALPSTRSESGKKLLIKYDKGKSTVVLSSPHRDIIISHLNGNKQQYEASKPSNMNERTIRPNDVPGRLLNMAFLNMGSTDHSLRLAAYNLLYSLSHSFKFNIGNQLLNARDLCIPSNSTSFIVSTSKRLAQTESHLTLEFLDEALVGLSKSPELMQELCLDYIIPWLQNIGRFMGRKPEDHSLSVAKTQEIIMRLIDLMIKDTRLYKQIQAKVWKTLAEVNEIIDMVLDCFIQYSVEKGPGSIQAEMVTDALVTMSSMQIRSKVISRMRRLIEGTSRQPCRQLVDHPSWKEIAVILRFILMLSFNNEEPMISHVPEIYHIVSILVVTGPTFIRSSVHELVVNTIHNLCTMNTTLPEENMKKLQYVLNDVCDSKNRVLFGLTKQTANAFTITKETTTDFADSISLPSLQNIVRLLLSTLTYGAATSEIANMWRARWMSLVTSTAFYFNPAIQPRAFVTLGCLSQDEVDDDLLYQMLVALKGALSIFIETEPNLIISITMCLTNIIDNLPTDSRYVLHLFWLAIALIQIGHPSIFQTAVGFLHSVLRALDSRKMFENRSVEKVLLEARSGLEIFALEIDNACGVNFNNYFSFAVAVILLKGLKQCETKDTVYQCLCAFLEIDSRQSIESGFIEARTLGYLAGLLPFASKDNSLDKLLKLAGFKEIDMENIDLGLSNAGLFDFLEIPDNNTALLLVSMLVTLLNASETESDRLFLYNLLADAATSVQEAFVLVYETLLPKMNQIVLNSKNSEVIDAVKNILLTTCSGQAFLPDTKQKHTQQSGLENLRFLALADPTFGAVKTNIIANAKMASMLLGAITD